MAKDLLRQARIAHRVRMNDLRTAGLVHLASMTCPQCGEKLTHNNSLAGTCWLQCLTPLSLTPKNGCGWQVCFDWEAR